jgi:hypothetical protein
MTRREQTIIEPAGHFSPAFNIWPEDYDQPGAALERLRQHLHYLSGLAECGLVMDAALKDHAKRAVFRVEIYLTQSNRDPDAPFDEDQALLHQAFLYAVGELTERAMDRVHQALHLDQNEVPPEQERQWTAALCGAHPNASWRDLGHEMAANLGTHWLLNYAAFPPDEVEPLTIRQATMAMAETAEAVPHPELRETYQRWAAVLLHQMVLPENN